MFHKKTLLNMRLSLSPNNAISPICSTSDSQQCFNNNSVLSSDSDSNDDKDWHFVVDRSIKTFLSFRGHFSCGNSRISSNNKSYNLPFCEQLIALQMCINQNPASLTVLPDTSSTTWFKFSFISEYLKYHLLDMMIHHLDDDDDDDDGDTTFGW